MNVDTLDEEKSFLDQPFAQASLRDHLRSEELGDRRHLRFQAAAESFLGVTESEIARHYSEFRDYDVPQITLSLEVGFPDWRLVKHGGASEERFLPWTPVWSRFEVGPGDFRKVLRQGTWFFELPDGGRRIYSLDEGPTPRLAGLTAVCRIADEPALLGELRHLRQHIDEHHYLRGTTIDANGKRFPPSTKVSWDDVALDEHVRQTVQNNVRQFLALREAFAKNGVPHRRGLLLYGPPGNGKTLIGKVLRATEPATFMYVTAADADNADALRDAFALARRLKPTIVFLEDLDMYAGDRRGSADCRTLGEILAQLDGMQDNDGLMVIATTNDLKAIEPALCERPNRFDVVVEVGPPGPAARRKILTRSLAKTVPLGDDLLNEAVARTDGFSGAHVQEAAWLLVQQAILNGSLTADRIAQPTRRDIEAALPTTPRRRRIGFTSSNGQENGSPSSTIR